MKPSVDCFIVFTGSFKLIRGFLKALLAFFLSEIVVLTIFEATLFTKDAAYVSLMDQIGSANFDVEGFSESFTNLLSTNEYLGNLVFIATAVATCVGTFVFLRHVAMATIKINFVMVNNQPIPMRGFAMIDKKVRKESHGEFRKDFFKATWFVGLMILISFIIAGVLQFFVIKNTNINQYFVMGLLISLILISPLLNYMVEVYHVMFAKYSASYAASFASVTLELITKFKDKLGVDDKDAETIKKMLEDSKKDKKDKDKKKK